MADLWKALVLAGALVCSDFPAMTIVDKSVKSGVWMEVVDSIPNGIVVCARWDGREGCFLIQRPSTIPEVKPLPNPFDPR